MSLSMRMTSADLDLMPDDGKRYEIIDGELFVARQPNWYHQLTCDNVIELLRQYSRATGIGTTVSAPGVIFSDEDDVAPDVVWITRGRFAEGLDAAGHLRIAPELIVEVLSPGERNERRDREVKLKLYSQRGVLEYWLPDWRTRSVLVYRRQGDALVFIGNLTERDALASPLLPGFACSVSDLFRGVPTSLT
jgi:Uma2 family endonuclease